MATAVGARSSQTYALAVVAKKPAARTGQFSAMVVYAPPSAHLVRDGQMFGLVPYEIGKFTVPRTSQYYALVVYATGVPDQSRSRAWTFTLDGHTFYVLDLGPEGTFLYDVVTKQWCKFVTDGFPGWNFTAGTMWGQSRIVGGDTLYDVVWEMNPLLVLDEGWRDINHVVTGGLATRSRTFVGVDAVRLSTSVGQLDEVNGATISLRFSDDQGKTWSDYFTISAEENDFTEEVAWRSLGSFMAPGRVFEISDVGGTIRIDGADAFVEGFDADQPTDPEVTGDQ